LSAGKALEQTVVKREREYKDASKYKRLTINATIPYTKRHA